MRYLSVCSGIEAASVAWHQLGWEPSGFSEIEKFPSQVLATRFPGVKNYGDMTKFREWDIERGTVDILVGGTPCQAFSVAGLRRGLEDPRGNLALVFVAMVDWYRPEWVVWENVPGVLSSNGGRDFGSFLGALGQLGYGWSYRILDAQYFGVAQRRRRVFLVAHSSGDARRASEVLFEPESLRGDPPPSREARESVAKCITTGIGKCFDPETDTFHIETHGSLYESHPPLGQQDNRQTFTSPKTGLFKEDSVSTTLTLNSGARGETQNPAWVIEPAVYESHPNDSRVTGPVEQCPTVAARWGTGGNNTPLVQQPMTQFGPVAGSLLHRHDSSPCADRGANVVAVQQPMAGDPVQVQWASGGGQVENSTAQALRAGAEHNYQFVRHEMAVRRLTPVECERLQGFPDGWTDIRPEGKDTPDSPRYKALGNSMAVPVMRWIGKRIDAAAR